MNEVVFMTWYSQKIYKLFIFTELPGLFLFNIYQVPTMKHLQ